MSTSEIKTPLPLDPPKLELNSEKRLWIGNLDTRLNEYLLLKILQKYGRILKLDFVYHKKGPLTGKPRGYCFVTYEKLSEAENAIKFLDGKIALSKRISVRWAHNISDVKTCSSTAKCSSEDSSDRDVNETIAAIEEKLNAMDKSGNQLGSSHSKSKS